MSLQLYGVAVAILPEKDSNESVSIHCTTHAANDNARREKVILENPAQTFVLNDVDPIHPVQLLDAFERVAGAMLSAQNLQKKALRQLRSSMGRRRLPHRPLALLVGKKHDAEYPLDNIHEKFLPYGMMLANDNRPELAQRFKYLIQSSYFRYGSYSQLRENLSDEEKARGLRKGEEPLNQRIIELRPLLADPKTSDRALNELVDIAYKFGQLMVLGTHATINAVWITRTPLHPDYKTDPAIRAQFPIYDFAGWHPNIRRAAIEGFKARLEKRDGVPIRFNCDYKTASEPRSPYFTDGTHPMILDQIDCALGRKTEADIRPQDNPTARRHILETYKNNRPRYIPRRRPRQPA